MGAKGSKQVVETVMPAGVYSNNWSDKHAARLTSEEFDLKGETSLYLHVIGGGGSRSRYVVQNYPRNGTVFKVNQLSSKDGNPLPWQWHTYQLGFWEGDAIHIELSTGKDSAVLTNGSDRSWFGIRRAMLFAKDAPHPNEQFRAEHLQPLIEVIGNDVPKTAVELADAFETALKLAVEAWGRGESSDGEALLIDQAIRHQLLPNSLDEIGGEAKRSVLAYRKLEKEIKIPTRVPGVDEWKGTDQPLFERGNHKKPLEPVSRRFVEAVDRSPYKTSQSGRLQLAEDLLRKDNPFTKRVIANRIWTHLFGNGIVGSVDNFGRLGEKPSPPELLEYLATRFDSQHGWSIKSLIKEIVQSKAWQQSSVIPEAARSVDPENRLLSYFPIRRLEAEAIRDTLISAAGQLDETMYGPAVDGRAPRRSVYVQVIRNRLDPFLSVFDAPIPFSTTGKRPVTNVPAQSLTMLNDSQISNYAKAFAARFSGSDEERIVEMWRVALGRDPLDVEKDASIGFLSQLRSKNDEITGELNQLKEQVAKYQSENSAMIASIRERLEGESQGDQEIDKETYGAVANWDFAKGTTDLVSGLIRAVDRECEGRGRCIGARWFL